MNKYTTRFLRLITAICLLAPLMPLKAEREGRPNVLLIGDSISIGYTDFVSKMLEDKAVVERIPGNGRSTNYGLEMLDRWLRGKDWAVIHFNFGIHDAKLPPEGIGHSPLEQYEQNLRQIVERLQKTGAKLVWASSTPIPFGGNFRPNRRFADITEYNRVAASVMEEFGIPVDDLHAAILPHADEYWKPRDLHFSEAGYHFLAKRVAEEIEKALPVPLAEQKAGGQD